MSQDHLAGAVRATLDPVPGSTRAPALEARLRRNLSQEGDDG